MSIGDFWNKPPCVYKAKRKVGRFSCILPLFVALKDEDHPARSLCLIKETLRKTFKSAKTPGDIYTIIWTSDE